MNAGIRDRDTAARLDQAPTLVALLEELKAGLEQYWSVADGILGACGVHLHRPGGEAYALPKNFFSLLFLYTYRRAGIPRVRRVLYAATLQCLRGMVTGCDNLLDDEYKPTLATDIPESGVRFRSVVDIMVSDRVLFNVLSDAATRGVIPREHILTAVTASMRTMMQSGVEEAAEEAGVNAILTPDEILETVHHLKTGILFQCCWDIPRIIETVPEATLDPLLEGLYRVGIGCQIMDDMVDLAMDIRLRKHNYLVSLIYHGPAGEEKARLEREMVRGAAYTVAPDVRHFPGAMQMARRTARRLLAEGIGTIFAEEDRDLVLPAMQFLAARIGAPVVMAEAEP